MFAELNELLGDSVERPRQGKLTLLGATKTDASFLVHHFLSFYLKAGCKVCFLALLQSFSHYNIVAQKLGLGLTTAKERGQLVFLEGLKASHDVLFSKRQELAEPHPFQFISGDGSDLKVLYDFVRTALSPAVGGEVWKGPVLIVDELSVLLSLGVRPADVLDFVHYCRVTVNSLLKGNVVVMVHGSDDSEDEENVLLAKALRHQSNRILWAEGLATGFCKDVHGQVLLDSNLASLLETLESLCHSEEIILTWMDRGSFFSRRQLHLTIVCRSSWEEKAERDLQQIYQYKIQDKNVTFFARGLSAAVL